MMHHCNKAVNSIDNEFGINKVNGLTFSVVLWSMKEYAMRCSQKAVR